MSLTDPVALLLAWVIAPAAVAALSAGLGAGVQALSGLRLGALTLPAGFLAGTVVVQVALQARLGTAPTAALVVLLACAAPALLAARRLRRGDRARSDRSSWGPRRLAAHPAFWPALAGLAAFLVGMAPLVGSGRAGIVGYVLSNDAAVHVSTVELLRDTGLRVPAAFDSSYAVTATQFKGYPLGSVAWPVVASELVALDAFFTWTPLIALIGAMTALAVHAVLRGLRAPAPLAAVAGAAVACGYLPFSWLVQGNAKEPALATALVAAVGLFAAAVAQGVTVRRLVPAAIAVAGGVAIFGLGALAFLGPAALMAAAVIVASAPPGRRLRVVGALALGCVVALVVTAPLLPAAVQFIRTADIRVQDQNAFGNLLAPVPWTQAFNVWLGGDYRYPTPDREALTVVGIVLAAVLAGVGLIWSAARRASAVPLTVVGGVAGTILISARASIYFDAKALVVLAVALGLATAAGVAAAFATRRWLGWAAGSVLLLLLAASNVAVYRQVWMTPKGRFQELIDLGERYAGQGPTLVNEREDYTRHFLRDAKPWESWGPWYVDRGLLAGGAPPPPPHAPDFDDYRLDFFERFRLLVERRRPGGSQPPSGFVPVEETRHYRVWRRSGPLPRIHVALGGGTVPGTGRVDCASPAMAALLQTARRDGGRVRYATAGRPITVSPPEDWLMYSWSQAGPQEPYVLRRGGFAVTTPRLPPGRYEAWVQGAFGPGIRLHHRDRPIGEVFSDLGIHDQWHRIGRFTVGVQQPVMSIVGLEKPAWQAGSRRPDLTGPLAFVPVPDGRRLRELPAAQAQSLCGRTLDWVELL